MNNASDYLAALDSRLAYEVAKNPECDSMQATLAAMRKTLERSAITDFMSASNVNAELINKSERSNARLNVYAYEKVLNVSQAALKVASLNHYTKAILATALSLDAYDESKLTHADAQSACSLSVKTKDSERQKRIVQYQKHVAANTASTQSSSSIAALVAYDVLRETRDDANVTCYSVNYDSHAFAALAR